MLIQLNLSLICIGFRMSPKQEQEKKKRKVRKCSSQDFNVPSAIVERQMLPVHTKATERLLDDFVIAFVILFLFMLMLFG